MRESCSQFVKKSSSQERPCQIDDVFKLLFKLRACGDLTQKQIDILLQYGNQFMCPDVSQEEEDEKMWQDALTKLEKLCLQKGFMVSKRD